MKWIFNYFAHLLFVSINSRFCPWWTNIPLYIYHSDRGLFFMDFKYLPGKWTSDYEQTSKATNSPGVFGGLTSVGKHESASLVCQQVNHGDSREVLSATENIPTRLCSPSFCPKHQALPLLTNSKLIFDTFLMDSLTD